MKPGNSLFYRGRVCVQLTPVDTNAEVIFYYAVDIGAINHVDGVADGEGQKIFVCFHGSGFDESVSFKELAARLDTTLATK